MNKLLMICRYDVFCGTNTQSIATIAQELRSQLFYLPGGMFLAHVEFGVVGSVSYA